MVSIRFKYIAALSVLILGNSLLAFTPGVRAKIGDLTRDIKNGKITEAEARKRALALKISPKDMNDSSVANLILTADSAGIQDLLNPAIVAETKPAIVPAPITAQPVTREEKPRLEQEVAQQPVDIKPEVITTTTQPIVEERKVDTKEVPAQLKPSETALQTLANELKALLSNANNILKEPKKITSTTANDIRNKYLLNKEAWEEKQKDIQDLNTRGFKHEAIDTLKKTVSTLIKEYDEASRNIEAFSYRNSTAERVMKNLTDINQNLKDKIKGNVSYSEQLADGDTIKKTEELKDFNSQSFTKYAIYQTEVNQVEKLKKEIENNIDKLLQMSRKAAEQKALKEKAPQNKDSQLLSQGQKKSLDALVKEYTDLTLSEGQYELYIPLRMNFTGRKSALIAEHIKDALTKNMSTINTIIESYALAKEDIVHLDGNAKAEAIKQLQRFLKQPTYSALFKNTTLTQNNYPNFVYLIDGVFNGTIPYTKEELDLTLPQLDKIAQKEQDEIAKVLKEKQALIDQYINKTFQEADFKKLMLNLRTQDQLLNDAETLFNLYKTASADDIEKQFNLMLSKEQWSIKDIVYGYLILLGAQYIAKTNPRPDVSENDVIDALKEFLSKTIDGKNLTGVTKPYSGQVSFVQVLDNYKDMYLNPAKITALPTSTAATKPTQPKTQNEEYLTKLIAGAKAAIQELEAIDKKDRISYEDKVKSEQLGNDRRYNFQQADGLKEEFTTQSEKQLYEEYSKLHRPQLDLEDKIQKRYAAQKPEWQTLLDTPPTTTAGKAPNVTTTGIKPYVNVAKRTYNQDQLQEYEAILKQKGYNRSIFLTNQDQFQKTSAESKEAQINTTLKNIEDTIKNTQQTFDNKLYLMILPRYYLVKQQLALYQFKLGQEQLEKVLETEMANPHGQLFSIGQYIDSFEQGYLK